ncbi:MAG: hypothetical protein R2813_13185 [Flavobacteriales bacterium]
MKRCSHCGQWAEGKPKVCPSCGNEFDKSYKKEIEERRKADDIHIPLWRIKPEDPIWLKIAKRPIQLVQLLFYSIVAFFIYLSTAFAH